MAPKRNFGHFVGDKSELGTHLLQQIDIAAAALAKCKAFTEINLFCVQPVMNDLVEKVIGRMRGEFLVERDHDRLFDTEHIKISQALIQCLQQRRGRIRMQYGAWMRVKGDGGRVCADLICPVYDRPHYPLVAEVQAVKNAQRQDGGLLYIRVLCAVEYLHTDRKFGHSVRIYRKI